LKDFNFLNNIIMIPELGALRSSLRGEKIVLGTGCFDLLHVGHLYFLWEARRQGDILIVGVNSDNAVTTLKGPGRPIIKQEQRVTLLAALRYVDRVFIYDDVVADDCILKLKPDVFAMGEESFKAYPSEVAAADSIGARIHTVTRVPELSTSFVVAEVLNKRQS
jgi:D-glycero-beta-D-manno-heptose 1-phosphate adenylyltransferase